MEYPLSHYVYDGAFNVIRAYRTNKKNAINGGFCQVEEKTYNANNDVVSTYVYGANVWDVSWNLTPTHSESYTVIN